MHRESNPSVIAYFSMEICLAEDIPTYSGGLGVLAGDTLRTAADLGLPMLAVTLVHRKGYFRQHLDNTGNQSESASEWKPEQRVERVDTQLQIEIEGRTVQVAVWKFTITGVDGGVVPVYMLDTALPGNSEWDRTLTDHLYGGDSRYRLCQEVLLGIGGALLLEQLGLAHGDVVHHINEGHAALLALRLLERVVGDRESWDVTEADLDAVRRQMVFTTHTPVPAGHDKFPIDSAMHVLGDRRARLLERALNGNAYELNVTLLALRLSRYCNAVAMRHAEVSREMFPDYPIHAITNGVHVGTWVSESYAELFDRRIAGWRRDNRYLRHAIGIPLEEIEEAHRKAKSQLLAEVERHSGVKLEESAFTLGFARRATPYKRADLIFADPGRLRSMVKKHGAIQIIFAGKAHPHDEPGKELIRRIFRAASNLADCMKVVYLESYDMRLGALLTSGVDLWLNNPMRPLEASGTSGMKAALNGVPSLSVLDGWWIEGHVEGVTGWSIGDDAATDADPSADVHELYYKLDKTILPLFYGSRGEWAKVMRYAIALNGSFFNTQRMLLQYAKNAYAVYDGVGEGAERGAAT